MRFKSETEHVLTFLRYYRNSSARLPLLEVCEALGLNHDMLCRGLRRLHIAGIISRDSRGPNSSYSYPPEMGLGEVVTAIEGIDIGPHSDTVRRFLNNVRL